MGSETIQSTIEDYADLQDITEYYLLQGYHITFRDQQSVQLMQEKKFGCLLGVLLLIFFTPAFFVYLISYLSQSSKTIYLRQDSETTVSITTGAGKQTVLSHYPTNNELYKAETSTSELFWRWFTIIVGGLYFVIVITIITYLIIVNM